MILVHTKGMRKILAETVPQMSESRSESALLHMLQQESKKKLFGDRIFTRNARVRCRNICTYKFLGVLRIMDHHIGSFTPLVCRDMTTCARCRSV
jgi:hypothetical protein